MDKIDYIYIITAFDLKTAVDYLKGSLPKNIKINKISGEM